MEHASPKACIVLGATGGIGSCVARRLARRGRKLAIGAATPERLQALAGALRDLGAPQVHAAVLDATQPAEVEAFAHEAAAALGGVSGVCNAVGSIILKPAHLTSDEEFERTLRLNLWSAFGVVRAAAKSMRRDGGSVVLFASAAATAGIPNHEAIAAAKGGVESLARSAAATYASSGLRFNVVAPGLVRTPGAAAITGSELSLKASEAMHALGRIGESDEVASLVEWLLSDDSAWMTGQTLGLDGGLATLRTRVKV